MARILTVCKDLGATNVVAPIADVLSLLGHEVFAVVEGKGADLWLKRGTILPIFRGTDDHELLPFSIDVEAVINRYRPDVVVVGESSPNNLEGEFARAAQQSNIPLVLVEDFWGGFRRIDDLTKSPDLILTLDRYAEILAYQQFIWEHPQIQVVIVGNPGVRIRIDPAPHVMSMREKGERIITFCGGGPETGEQIELLLACLAITSGNWRLIPRWHPKEVDRTDPVGGKTYGETWSVLFEPLGDRVVYLPGPSTESVVVASDIVVAGFSTLLTTAAKAGVVTVALATPLVQRSLEEESGLTEIPQVKLLAAKLVTKPTDLAQLRPSSRAARSRLKPLNAKAGARAIHAFLENRSRH